jgi:hypothetical protein
MLLQYEMNRHRLLGGLRILRLHQPEPPVALPAVVIATPAVDREFPEPALPHCHRDCCEPIRRCPRYVLPVPRTSGSQLPALVRELRSAGLRLVFRWQSSSDQIVILPYCRPEVTLRTSDAGVNSPYSSDDFCSIVSIVTPATPDAGHKKRNVV